MHDIQTLVDSYKYWYHEIDFGNGVISKPRQPSENNRAIWGAIQGFLDGIEFQGRSVLDIGCWDGRWSFYAEKRGAARVLATDCLTQRWGGTTGFDIAHRVLGSRVEYRGDIDIYHASEQLRGERFDVVLCPGVYYHLTHAVTAFTQLRHLVADGGVVFVEGSALNEQERSYAEFLCGSGPEPDRCDPSNWTIPTRRWVRDVLGANYFTIARESFPFNAPRGRILVEARPMQGRNPEHMYKPAFGLHRYDERWCHEPA